MPFIVQPPQYSAVAGNPSLIYTIIEPDQTEEVMLQDLETWGWRVTEHSFGDEEFIDALKLIEKDTKRRRRQTHAVAGELHGYEERLTLENVWSKEADRMLGENAYEVGRKGVEMYVSAQIASNRLPTCSIILLTHPGTGFKRSTAPGRRTISSIIVTCGDSVLDW
jgi:hypothetical protein